MKCEPKWSSELILAVNSIIVAAIFLIVHLVWYGHNDFSTYSRSWQEIVATCVFAIFYAYLFNKVSYHWRTNFAYGFVNRKVDVSAPCGHSGTNFLNAMIFSGIMMVIVFAVMYLAGMFISTFYVFILDGIRGAVPDGGTDDAAAIAIQVGGATAGLELFGKTEGSPRRPM
jgi:hypothetical protein